MPKARKRSKKKYTTGTVWFLAILIVSLIGIVIPVNKMVIWLILGICGAIVAYKNIQRKEENSFLIGTSALLLIIMMILLIPDFYKIALSFVGDFLINLGIAFGVAGFVVALGLISRLGLEK